MLKSKARCCSFCFNFLPCHVANPTLMKIITIRWCMFWTSAPKDLPHNAVYSFLFFLPPVLCCVVCVKSTSNSTGSILRLIWLLFLCTSPSYTQSTSNASPFQASKSGMVCFCPSCPFPVPGAGVYAGIFISKHMLDVLIPYGLIFASFWWGPAVSLWCICARSYL